MLKHVPPTLSGDSKDHPVLWNECEQAPSCKSPTIFFKDTHYGLAKCNHGNEVTSATSCWRQTLPTRRWRTGKDVRTRRWAPWALIPESAVSWPLTRRWERKCYNRQLSKIQNCMKPPPNSTTFLQLIHREISLQLGLRRDSMEGQRVVSYQQSFQAEAVQLINPDTCNLLTTQMFDIQLLTKKAGKDMDFPWSAWLRLCLPMQGMQVWSLFRKLSSHMLWGMAKILFKQKIWKNIHMSCTATICQTLLWKLYGDLFLN